MNEALANYRFHEAAFNIYHFFWHEFCDWYLEFIKPRFKEEESAPVARSVLALALDQVLRLFHPFVPFITEVLWERLNAQCPVRGLEMPIVSPDFLISAAWPERTPEWEDGSIEADFALLEDVIRSVREFRSLHNIAPSRRLEALIKAAGRSADILRQMKPLILHMANLTSLDVAVDIKRQVTAATLVVGDMEIYLAGLVDTDKERQRLNSKRGKLLEDARKDEAKLSNESFVSRAPADVVEKERQRLKDLQAQIELIDANLKAL
jgi:valyl-tRNA synthetase